MITNDTLDAELAALLEREKKLKQIRAAQIRIQKLETKMQRCGTAAGAALKVIGGLVSAETGVQWDEIIAKTKIQRIVDARQMVCYFARRFGCGLADIGRQMRLDHGTVHYAYHKIQNLISVDKKFAARLAALEPQIKSALEKEGVLE